MAQIMMTVTRTLPAALAFLVSSFLLLPIICKAELSNKFALMIYPDNENPYGLELGCRNFKIGLNIQKFGYAFLGRGVCSGYVAPSGGAEAYHAIEFNSDEARYGVDIKTISVRVAGDLALVIWNSVSRGMGGYVDQEVALFAKGEIQPLFFDNVLIQGRWGADSSLWGEIEVVDFQPDSLYLRVFSSRHQVFHDQDILHREPVEGGGYGGNVTLEKEVKLNLEGPPYEITDFDVRVFYREQWKETREHVADYFNLDHSLFDESAGGARLELLIKNNKRFSHLFVPVRDDNARSLEDLLGIAMKSVSDD